MLTDARRQRDDLLVAVPGLDPGLTVETTSAGFDSAHPLMQRFRVLAVRRTANAAQGHADLWNDKIRDWPVARVVYTPEGYTAIVPACSFDRSAAAPAAAFIDGYGNPARIDLEDGA